MHNRSQDEQHGQKREQRPCLPGVVCDVTNCVYNDLNKACTAKEIQVGPQFATTSYDTICATFKPD